MKKNQNKTDEKEPRWCLLPYPEGGRWKFCNERRKCKECVENYLENQQRWQISKSINY
jgi:hypothetical protein